MSISVGEANEVAHPLTKNSFSEKICMFWESIIPDFISHYIVLPLFYNSIKHVFVL